MFVYVPNIISLHTWADILRKPDPDFKHVIGQAGHLDQSLTYDLGRFDNALHDVTE